MEPLVAALQHARHVAVLTGAGVSAESGLPTFREAQTGLWARYDPYELGTPEGFRRDPALVWRWYAWRRELAEAARPNPAHEALARLERLVPRFTLITQNVDGLHQLAGSRRVLELHGNLRRTRCFDCQQPAVAWDETETPPPRCGACHGPLRPDVVWFNEQLPADILQESIEAARTADVFLTIGTSAVVYPAALLPEHALACGACVVEVNAGETPFSARATHVLRGKAGEVLPPLVVALSAALS